LVFDVVVPKLGLTATEATIVQWLKNKGEHVRAGNAILEIMTDKVNFEVESPAEGILAEIFNGEEETVPVGTVVGRIVARGDAATEEERKAPSNADVVRGTSAEEIREGEKGFDRIKASPAARRLAKERGIGLAGIHGTGDDGRIVARDIEAGAKEAPRIRATPLAVKMAASQGIDLRKIEGTGPAGKIVRDDVAAHASRETAAPRERPPTEALPAAEAQVIPYSGMRRIIGDRMHESATTTAAVTLMGRFNVESMVSMRRELLAEVERETGARLTYTDLLVKIVAHAVRDYPRINASLTEEGVVLHPHINIGMAVALSEGLMVPVIRNPQALSLAQIAVQTKDLAERARSGRIRPEELQGGSITLSNLGRYSVDSFGPIINLPECAIVGVGRIQEQPAAVHGGLVIKPLMSVSVVFDHRVLDGAQAAEFLTILGKYLERCSMLLG
jgi:pyruvate dehydrogenase E2 component (dihydrolipoamide acetyltransferase)